MNSARSLAPSREKSRTKGSSAPAAFSDWVVDFSDKPIGFSKTGSPSLGIAYVFVYVLVKSLMGSFSSYLFKMLFSFSLMLFSFSLMFCSFKGFGEGKER